MDNTILIGVILFAVIAVYAYRKKSKNNKTTSTNPHFEWVDVPVTKTEWVVTEPAHKEYVYKED